MRRRPLRDWQTVGRGLPGESAEVPRHALRGRRARPLPGGQGKRLGCGGEVSGRRPQLRPLRLRDAARAGRGRGDGPRGGPGPAVHPRDRLQLRQDHGPVHILCRGGEGHAGRSGDPRAERGLAPRIDAGPASDPPRQRRPRIRALPLRKPLVPPELRRDRQLREPHPGPAGRHEAAGAPFLLHLQGDAAAADRLCPRDSPQAGARAGLLPPGRFRGQHDGHRGGRRRRRPDPPRRRMSLSTPTTTRRSGSRPSTRHPSSSRTPVPGPGGCASGSKTSTAGSPRRS